MDLRQLRHFEATAEALSFSRAAESLHITQPALSESIRELEAELGTELLVRSTRHVSLTWPGKILLEEAKRIIRMTDQAVRLTRDAAIGDAGSLRVGAKEDRQPIGSQGRSCGWKTMAKRAPLTRPSNSTGDAALK